MSISSIQLTETTKRRLKLLARDGESYESVILSLLGDETINGIDQAKAVCDEIKEQQREKAEKAVKEAYFQKIRSYNDSVETAPRWNPRSKEYMKRIKEG